MQRPTDPAAAGAPSRRPTPRGDEGELYRRHHRDLHRTVARAVIGSRELIEDACQTAWLILLRRQPERDHVFGHLDARSALARVAELPARQRRLFALQLAGLSYAEAPL